MKFRGLFACIAALSFFVFSSCTKINEATELGDDLIPAVDNVNTFDTTLAVEGAYHPFFDSSRTLLSDNLALGRITDPVFGSTTADMYFTLGSPVYGASPFRDTVLGIDSVVLSLSYRGTYGDTNASVTVDVSEIDPNNGFVDTTLYRFDVSGFSTGSRLGTRSFLPSTLNDPVTVITGRDTARVTNVLRIPLSNSVGEKLRRFDTSATGGYRSDSLFRTLFRGLAVKATSATGNGALTYYNLNDANSALVVYYKSSRNGVRDTSTVRFPARTYARANAIRRTASGEFSAKAGNANAQKLYIESAPAGSYAGLFVPGLTNFPNKVIHRAELIAVRVPADNSSLDNIFTPPSRLLLDHKGPSNAVDSATFFSNDLLLNPDCSVSFGAFGGAFERDETYRFNITRYIQGLVTRRERNDSLRLYAPLRATYLSPVGGCGRYIFVPNLENIAFGRVVLANGNDPDPRRRLRLRIIYSNL